MNFQTINPATEEVVKEFRTIPREEALQAAKRSKRNSEWRRLTVSQRAEYLRNLARSLRKNSENYAQLITIEMGKPLTQSKAEIEKCAWTAEVYAAKGERWLGEELVQTDAKKSIITFEPLGVILSVMPWNFPFWQALRFAIPALLTGNVSLLRHSNVVPQCALAIEEAFTEADFPEGTFKTLITDHDTVAKLIASEYIDGVSVTGSISVGAKIAEIAGKNLKKFVLELGGSDPFIVLEDADLQLTARNAAEARLINTGQSCIAAKRFIVVRSVAREFSESFAEYAGKMVVGNPMDEKTEVGPLVNADQLDQVQSQVADAVQKGAKILTGGRRLRRKGYFYEPTVLSRTNSKMRVVREEVFGPVAPIIVARDEEEAIRIANGSDFGLGASVWTADEQRGLQVARKLEAGAVFVNGIVKSDPRMPFGGVKKSGIGRELSKYGLREFVNVKGITIYEAGSRITPRTE